MFKQLYKELQRELLSAHTKVHTALWVKSLEKNKAKLAYEKLQHVKAGKPVEEVEQKLKALEANKPAIPPLEESKLLALSQDKDDIQGLQTVVSYLKAQREYNELLERYNPGLTMNQLDNVRKSANMVGLQIPE